MKIGLKQEVTETHDRDWEAIAKAFGTVNWSLVRYRRYVEERKSKWISKHTKDR